MKHAVLRSIAHNLADNMGGGCGFLIGYYTMDVFGDARRSSGGVLELDILTGLCVEGAPSEATLGAAALYSKALPDLCARQGASVEAFKLLRVRFRSDAIGPSFEVIVEDAAGKRSVDRYVGWSCARPKFLDARGRIRTRR
jgi:hypothetical protein